MKTENVLIWGYYGANNFGDDLLFESVFNLLKKNCKNTSVYYTVKDINNAYKVDAIPVVFFGKNNSNKVFNFLINLKILFSTIAKMDIIIIGGGTQYFEIESRKPISILLKYLSCCVVKFKGGKFINAGIGIGRVNSIIGKFCLKRIFQKANYSFVRDHQSKETLLRLGVLSNKIALGKDLSYFLNGSQTKNNQNNNYINIGVNFFDYYDYLEKDPAKRNVYINAIKGFLKHLHSKKNIKIFYFALQNKTGGKDFEFMNEIKLKENEKVFFYKDDFNGFINELGLMDYCIGLRYHFAVLALQNKIPTIGISYQPKVERELKEFGLENYVIKIEGISESILISKFEELIEKDNIKEQIGQTLNKVSASIIVTEFVKALKS